MNCPICGSKCKETKDENGTLYYCDDIVIGSIVQYIVWTR
jgi:hypothetical protein